MSATSKLTASLREPAILGVLASSLTISLLNVARPVLPTTIVATLGLLLLGCIVLPTYRAGGKAEDGLSSKDSDAGTVLREEGGVTSRAALIPLRLSQRSTPLPDVTMAEVAKHDVQTDLWVVINGVAYDVTTFADAHPGGAMPLVGVAGRDATDAFENYHSARVTEKLLPSYAVGRVTDVPAVPPAVADFRELRQTLLARGLFATEVRLPWNHQHTPRHTPLSTLRSLCGRHATDLAG